MKHSLYNIILIFVIIAFVVFSFFCYKDYCNYGYINDMAYAIIGVVSAMYIATNLKLGGYKR